MKTIPGKPGRLDKKSKTVQRLYKLINKVPFIPSAGRYKLTVSHSRKFIWFRVPKAGSSTILSHLRESDVHLDMERAGRIHYPVKLYKDYFKFAFVRNP
ncbi:MAG: sulfotransferase family 2 domain-containing protein, partial [Gammaproteobacteria bacterium]|nr:sulfotransferase family 2 domain-containing protein [Gammaproteobacteria bacterium]